MYEKELKLLKSNCKVVHTREGIVIDEPYKKGDTVHIRGAYVDVRLTDISDPIFIANQLIVAMNNEYKMGRKHLRMQFKRLLDE